MIAEQLPPIDSSIDQYIKDINYIENFSQKAEILTSCCPSCNKTFLDALREQDRDIRVLDLAVYIAEKLDLLD